MEEKVTKDPRVESVLKLMSLNDEQRVLLEERMAREAEFKAYLHENDKALEAINERQYAIAKSAIAIDIKNLGHVSDELKGCLEGLEIKLDGDKLAENKTSREVHTERYKGFVCGNNQDVRTRVVYGNSIDEVLNGADKLMKRNASYTSVNLGTFNEAEGQYENFRKYDIARRYDVSPVYLNLPRLENEEFSALTKMLKSEGAKFNPAIKRWYVPYEIAGKEAFKPYISEQPRQRDYSLQRHYTSQELALPVENTGKTVNDMLRENRGYIRITYEYAGDNKIVPRAEFYDGKPAETERTGRWLSEVNVRTLVVEGNELNKDILYPGEGYYIQNEKEMRPSTPYASVVKVTETGGDFYYIYGIHDISGETYRLSPRRFDTQQQAEENIPKGFKNVSVEELQKTSGIYMDSWSEMIRDDLKASGFDNLKCSNYLIRCIRNLNYLTNKNWGLNEISKVYTQMEGDKLPADYNYLSDMAVESIKNIGDICKSQEIMRAEMAVPAN